jgi:preprotein translocase subunit Sec63
LENAENEDFQEYVFQLKRLSELRSLQDELKDEVENMPFKFKYNVEKDPFYIEGISQGISKANYEIIVRMLGLSFSHEQIAEIVNTKVEFVKEIAGKLNQK